MSYRRFSASLPRPLSIRFYVVYAGRVQSRHHCWVVWPLGLRLSKARIAFSRCEPGEPLCQQPDPSADIAGHQPRLLRSLFACLCVLGRLNVTMSANDDVLRRSCQHLAKPRIICQGGDDLLVAAWRTVAEERRPETFDLEYDRLG